MPEFDWLNEDSRTFLSRGYLLPGVTAEERVRQIGDVAEAKLRKMGAPDSFVDGFSDRFYKYMGKGYYSLASPVWSNFGLERGLPISCFGSYIDDTMESILFTHAEVGMMTKGGGGTSGYFGHIRPRGSSISENGTSNGTFPFAQLFDKEINVISQGSVRRGHFAGYIDIEHEDIEEWLNIQTEGNPIQDMMWGVVVGDTFMEEMIAGDQKKREIWAEVLKSRMHLGIPYIMFRGNANSGKHATSGAPDVYRDKDLPIHASNLCMTGDQRVVTDRGYLTAEELYEQGDRLTLFDGEKRVDSSPMKLREESADVYKITLANGLEHKVTAYHGLPVYQGRGKYKRVEAQDVEVGDRIVIQKKKGLFGDTSMPDEASLLGLYQSDGTQYKETRFIDVWENSTMDLVPEIEQTLDRVYKKHGFDSYEAGNGRTRGRETPTFYTQSKTQGGVKKKRIASTKLRKLGFEKGRVPDWIWQSDEETQWAYVRGLLFADGSAHMSESTGNPIQIAYADVDRNFLQELQLLFNNLGLSSQIRLLRKAGKNSLPDGKGGYKEYDTKDCWRLIISNKSAALAIEKNTGFLSRKGVELEDRAYRNNTKKAYAVESIEYVGKEPVYCPTVDTKEHVFIAQGMLTFNCSEIMLHSSPEESFVCCLSSYNLAKYHEWKDNPDVVHTLIYLLDAVMKEFIEKASKMQFMERPVRFARRQRALGAGALGWHDHLQKDGIPFDSPEAMQRNAEIFRLLGTETHKASETLAEHLGEPELLEGYGRRNATTMAVAPTKSSSFILGQVSPSIEPLKSNYFVRDGAKLKATYKNPRLKALLQKKGKDTRDVWESIAVRDGSVQHLDFLSEKEKAVFQTFKEIPQMAIIKQAAQRQQFIDQGQSLNLTIDPNNVPLKDINALYIEAWQTGVKALYYQNAVNAAQEFSRSILDCASCEG